MIKRNYIGLLVFCIWLAGAASNAIAAGPARFFTVPPCRVMDTRDGQGRTGPFGPPILAAGETREVPIPAGACGIPADAQAYSINVTVVPSGPLGYLTVWPAGQALPQVSTLNSPDGRIVANAALVPAGTDGAISVFVSNPAQVIIDINGYFGPFSDTVGLPFYPAPPCRAVDTRPETGTSGAFGPPVLDAAMHRDFPLAAAPCGIPPANAYSLNATAVPQGSLGYLTLWPAGSPQPLVSTLNSLDGRVAANAAIVTAGPGGSVSAFAPDATHLILDVNGYFGPPTLLSGFSFYPVPPCRLVDTRQGEGKSGEFGPPALAAGSTRSFAIPGNCGVPQIPLSGYGAVFAYSLNITVVPRGTLSYLTVWPAGGNPPVVSTLNSFDGGVVANAAIVRSGTLGAISVFVAGPTDVVIDINGYFAP